MRDRLPVEQRQIEERSQTQNMRLIMLGYGDIEMAHYTMFPEIHTEQSVSEK
jgi:hypothetical protein